MSATQELGPVDDHNCSQPNSECDVQKNVNDYIWQWLTISAPKMLPIEGKL
jgi:hypothetical protein